MSGKRDCGRVWQVFQVFCGFWLWLLFNILSLGFHLNSNHVTFNCLLYFGSWSDCCFCFWSLCVCFGVLAMILMSFSCSPLFLLMFWCLQYFLFLVWVPSNMSDLFLLSAIISNMSLFLCLIFIFWLLLALLWRLFFLLCPVLLILPAFSTFFYGNKHSKKKKKSPDTSRLITVTSSLWEGSLGYYRMSVRCSDFPQHWPDITRL